VQLRPYQAECLQAIHAAARRRVWRQLVVLPTGAGKTVVFAHLPGWLRMQKRLLVLAHREELIQQAAAKFKAVDAQLTVGIEQAGQRCQAGHQVVVASVPTLGHPRSGRIERFRPEDFSLVVCDEAHHSTAASYQRVFEYFRAGQPGGPLLLGVTATPHRGDGVGLQDVYDEVVFERTIRQLMVPDASDPASPYLCPLRAWRVETGTDLQGVHTRNGDYVVSELSASVNTPWRNELIVRCYQDRCAGQRAIAFCVDVAHARAVADLFVQNGIRAAAVTGQTPREERQGLLRRFHQGDIDVLTNCNVLTEGFDEPRVACLLMARPTQSVLLYTQMVGRGTRVCDRCARAGCEHKPWLTVVDLADNGRHALPTSTTLLGLPPHWKPQGENLLEQATALETIAQQCPQAARQAATLEEARRLMQEFDLLGDPVAQAEVAALTPLSWILLPDGQLHLGLGSGYSLRLRENLLGHWMAVREVDGGLETTLGQFKSRAQALSACDAYVRQNYPDTLRLTERGAAWRGQPASPKQRDWLQKIGRWREGLTKGEASRMLDAWSARQPR
jgi:superfamily II DNA or RNA helicase